VVALRHCAAASDLKIRRVERETRCPVLGQCSDPAGIVIWSCEIACVIRRQTAALAASPSHREIMGADDAFGLSIGQENTSVKAIRRIPFRRDVVFDPGGATAPRITVPHMLPSTLLMNGSASAILWISRLNLPPHRIAVYASQSPSPTTTQHLLSGGLLRPYPRRSSTGWNTPAFPALLTTSSSYWAQCAGASGGGGLCGVDRRLRGRHRLTAADPCNKVSFCGNLASFAVLHESSANGLARMLQRVL
jgi:hypothetical protein